MERDLPPPGQTLSSLTDRFGGSIRGDADRLICGVAPLDRAGESDLAFLANSRYKPAFEASKAACVLISPRHLEGLHPPAGVALWLHDNPYAQFARVAQLFAAEVAPALPGIHPSAVIGPGANIAPGSSIGAHCVIGARAQVADKVVIAEGCSIGADVHIGTGTRLYPRVVIYHGCVVGERCILHSGVVLGADGFGFAPDGDIWVKIPQTGRTLIGDDVEIGANTTIDRGTMGDTVIGDGAKLDNQIQIGHNCEIGAGTVMAGCSAVAGSTRIGRHCQIGGAAMIIGHLSIVDEVVISVGTVVSHSIHQKGFYTGFFPMSDNATWEKNAVLVRQLDRMRKRLKALEQQHKGHS
jgi:UDP-3-O-[3-hydroxymyristoyl] glucosamine N-acyltransferase